MVILSQWYIIANEAVSMYKIDWLAARCWILMRIWIRLHISFGLTRRFIETHLKAKNAVSASSSSLRYTYSNFKCHHGVSVWKRFFFQRGLVRSLNEMIIVKVFMAYSGLHSVQNKFQKEIKIAIDKSVDEILIMKWRKCVNWSRNSLIFCLSFHESKGKKTKHWQTLQRFSECRRHLLPQSICNAKMWSQPDQFDLEWCFSA